MKNTLTFDEAKKQIGYDPRSGEFWRLKKTVNSKPINERFSHAPASNGYQMISVNGRRYYLHRLAWLLVHGQWPEHHIDHINGDRTDNRLANLREVTNHLNCFNRKARKPSFHLATGLWRVRITVSGREKCKFFRDMDDASEFSDLLSEVIRATPSLYAGGHP